MYPFKPQIMIIRFLGITPTSSAVHTTLISICQQLCYNLEVPIEEIPTDFVPLKNYFKSLLDLASKTMFTVILLGKLLFRTFIFSTYSIIRIHALFHIFYKRQIILHQLLVDDTYLHQQSI